MKRVSAIFLQGLFALLPLAVTVLVLFWLGSAAERSLGSAIRWFFPSGWYIPGMGVLAGLVLTLVLGLLVNLWGMPQLIRLGERFIGRIPLVKTIYGAVRDLLGFFSNSSGLGADSRVVMVSLGQTGVRVVGFVTRERFDDLPTGLGGEGEIAVYVPFSYQVGGFTLILPLEQVQPLDIRLEDAFRFILTGGVQAGVSGGLPAESSPRGNGADGPPSDPAPTAHRSSRATEHG